MKYSHNGSVRTGLQIFRIPLLLALLTVVGLTSALLGNDGWDVLSWISLLILVGTTAWALRPAQA